MLPLTYGFALLTVLSAQSYFRELIQRQIRSAYVLVLDIHKFLIFQRIVHIPIHGTDRYADHHATVTDQTNHLGISHTFVDGIAIAQYGDTLKFLGRMPYKTMHGRDRDLQIHTGIQHILKHRQTDHIVERVQSTYLGTTRKQYGRLDYPFTSQVIKLSMSDPGNPGRHRSLISPTGGALPHIKQLSLNGVRQRLHSSSCRDVQTKTNRGVFDH